MTTDTTKLDLITEALDLDNLTEQEQEEILLDLNSLVLKGTMVRLMERMDEQTRNDFNTLMDGNPSEDAVSAFLQARVPDADSALTETIQDLSDDILAVSQS